MEPAEIKNMDEKDSWSLLHYHRQVPVQARPRSDFMVLILAVFVHVGFIGYLFSWRAPALQHAIVDDDVLEVTFIDRASDAVLKEAESRTATDKNQNPKPVGRRLFARPNTQTTTTANRAGEIQDTTLRLTLDNDEWNVAPVIVPKKLLQRQFIAMPGRAEPFIHGIKLSNKPTPEQLLRQVGKQLFGAVDYDPCKEARNRMASGQSQMHDLDVEADLRSIERNCRP